MSLFPGHGHGKWDSKTLFPPLLDRRGSTYKKIHKGLYLQVS